MRVELINAMDSDWLYEIAVDYISRSKQLVMECHKNRTQGLLKPLRPLNYECDRTFNARRSSPGPAIAIIIKL